MAADVADQTAENRQSPNVPVAREILNDLGVLSWHIPINGREYPAKAVPWDPKDVQEPALATVRRQRGYNYADIITCSEECLPDYKNKLKAFFTEHIHSDEEVRYILKGSGYFDVRDNGDKWIRIKMDEGDMIVLPEGIYHRFTMDAKNFTHAMRLFKGNPVWVAIDRPADENVSRQRYVDRFHPLPEEQALREAIPKMLKTFYGHGWCLGSSGAVGVLVGSGASAPILVTPSGVPKEELKPSDLFLSSGGELLKIPEKSGCKVTDSLDVFASIFRSCPKVRAVSHVHSISAVTAAAQCSEDVLRIGQLEMIKGLGVRNDEILEVPIVPNSPTEPELIPAIEAALRQRPDSKAIIVREHGAYIFGETLERAKIATECLMFALAVLEKQPSRILSPRGEGPTSKRARSPHVVLLDIEGTTTPISFVKDNLFPYAARSVGPWLQSKPAALPAVAKSFQEQCRQDGSDVFDEKDAVEAVERLTQEWIAKDRKVPALKELQGLLWRSGYEQGELKGEMYDDTPKAMEGWVASGKRVAIFSSGSREAQQLIFKYSDKGDLTHHISAYFDPKSAQASKQEERAYLEIALSLGISPADGVFCTDILGEAQAAEKAGWTAVLLVRPGNAPLPEKHGFRTLTSLAQL